MKNNKTGNCLQLKELLEGPHAQNWDKMRLEHPHGKT